MLSIEEVMKAIDSEINYQNSKWGADKQQSLPGYIAVMQKELQDATTGWCENRIGHRATPLEEILQTVAVGIRCLRQYGVVGSAGATNDESAINTRQLNEGVVDDQRLYAHPGREENVITLTLRDGSPIILAKRLFLNCYANAFTPETTVVTKQGDNIYVLESVHAIQAMLQD